MESALSIFRSAWDTYRREWKALTAIAAIPSLLLFLGTALAFAGGAAIIVGPIVSIAGGIVMIVMQASLIAAAREAVAGRPVSWKASYRVGFSLFWPILLLLVMQILVGFGSIALFIIPGIVVGIYTSFYLFALVIDGARGWSAFLASFQAVSGRWWAVFRKLLFIAFVSLIVSVAIVGLEFLFDIHTGKGASAGDQVAGTALSLLANLIVIPVVSIYMYRLYEALKATRSTDAPVGTFKMWLMIFLILGILAAIALPFILGGILVSHVAAPIVPTVPAA